MRRRGFSLIEVMIALFIMSGVIYGIMHVTKSVSKLDSKIMDSADMQDLINRVRFTLNDTISCNRSIEGSYPDLLMESRGDIDKIVSKRDIDILYPEQTYGRVEVLNISYAFDEESMPEDYESGIIFVNLYIRLIGRNKLNIERRFQITVAMEFTEVREVDNTLFYKFGGCDSMTNPMVEELLNEMMKRVCSTLGVEYNTSTGQCDKMNSLPKNMTPEQMQQIIQQTFKNGQ